MIQVISISFQLAGALILLLWSFKAIGKESVKDRCFVKGTHIERDENGNGHIDKKRAQNVSKEALLNVFAFINLIIGYGITFWESDNYYRWCAILITCITVVCILALEYFLSWFISCIRFQQDIVLTSKEIEERGIITNIINSEIDALFKEDE